MVAVVIAALAVAWAAVLVSVRPKPAAASGAGAGPPAAGERVSPPSPGEPDAGLAARRQAVARGLAETVDANLTAMIVEAVGLQPALAREAPSAGVPGPM